MIRVHAFIKLVIQLLSQIAEILLKRKCFKLFFYCYVKKDCSFLQYECRGRRRNSNSIPIGKGYNRLIIDILYFIKLIILFL